MNITKIIAVVGFTAFALAGCARTDIQPLSATSFKVATEAAPACGRSGAREVANQAAAIEVINRGGDRFIFVGESTGSRVTGVSYNSYGYAQTYNNNEQGLVVQMLSKGDKGYENSLSARALLGNDWQEIVANGIPDTC
ncbi:hypothetical protein N9P17_04095 [Tateyamaria sp.]|nr:hypothetical protein [Tateyamaria sp.]